MLTITIKGGEAYNEKTNKFVTIPPKTIKLEHSLLSLQKWESKHHKYFIGNKDLSYEEHLDYIKCMTINSDVEDYIYDFLSNENMREIKEYIEDPMTGTFFNDSLTPKNKKKEIVTAEVIYSSMIILGIPVELFEKRHLNHLIALIRVCNEKQNPDSNKNVNERDLARHYSELNKARRAQMKTKG